MTEISATITSKGQITIPAEVRRHLHVDVSDQVIFVIKPDGEVQIKVPKYPKPRSMAGVAATLPASAKGLTPRQMREIAHDDRAEHRRMKQLD